MIPTPPFTVLSTDGRLAAAEQGGQIQLIDVQAGAGRPLELPHGAQIYALSPLATYLAAADDETLTLLTTAAPDRPAATIALAEPLFRLAVGDGGLVVGVSADEEGGTGTLYAWRDGQALPWLGGGHDLGELTAFELHLAEEWHRLLICGVAGPGSYYGEGDPAVRLFEIDDQGISELWDGAGLPVAEPNGCLLPLATGNFGVYDGHQLAILSPDQPRAAIATPVETLDLGDLETVVASPDGRFVAWFFSDDSDLETPFRLKVARLADGQLLDACTFSELGQFPALAVDNDGAATLIAGEMPAAVAISRLSQGEYATIATLTLA